MIKCDKCGTEMSKDESTEIAGENLCEDCHLDMMAKPKACDPWAVYSATRTVQQEKILTEDQQRILDLIQSRGPMNEQEICAALNLTSDQFTTNFVALRHMELAHGFRKDGQIYFTTFGD